MAMTAGTVAVDDSGNVTATPDDETNCARALYLALLASDDSDPPTTPQTSITPPSCTVNPDGSMTTTDPVITTTQVPITSLESDGGVARKKASAKVANAMASWLVPYLQLNAQVYIANDASTDGTFRDSGSADCLHPTIPRTLPII